MAGPYKGRSAFVNLLSLLTAAALLGCSDNLTNPTDTPKAPPNLSATCQLGCVDQDPNPSAPGYFLGNEITADYCTDTESFGDADEDGLVDYCEKTLAAKVAPEMYWAYTYDDVRREPYWAARPSTGKVRIGYLFSYYRDLGSDAAGCVPPFHPLCDSHNGDSEAVFLEVYYNGSTHHWVLGSAWYSQHGSYPNFDKGTSAYPTALTYPTKAGGYPRTWVAENKHANYPSQSSCNSGGLFGTDTCVHNNTATRVDASGVWNIGSASDPFYDCVASRDPSYEYFGLGRTECFWTQKDFRGWVPDSIGGGQAGPYSVVLANQGF